MGGLQSALRELREVNTAQSSRIEKLEGVVSTLKLENARVVAPLTEEIVESYSFKNHVEVLIQGRELRYVRTSIKGVQLDPNFEQTLNIKCQATMTYEIQRHLEG